MTHAVWVEPDSRSLSTTAGDRLVRASVLCRFLRMRGQGALVTALIAATLGLTACSGDGEPPPTTTPTPLLASSPTPGPTPAPSPSASTPPTGFDASVAPSPPHDLEGPASKQAAGAVAAYFVSLFPYISATGDFRAWDALSGEFCDYCANARAMAQEDASQNRHSVGGQVVVGHTTLFDYRKNEYAVLLEISQMPWQTLDADGVVVDEGVETTRGTVDMVVRWHGGSWTIESASLRQSGTG